MAADLGLAMTGGSDYHGPDSRRAAAFGHVHLPVAEFAPFLAKRPPRQP
jgi:hypothetical protein